MTGRVLIPYRHAKKAEPYHAAALAAGLEPLLADVAGPVSLETCDSLLLMGGTDINPRRYGQEARPETEEPDDERDEKELALVELALERGLPTLAICRGLQLVNVYFGGTLIQHLRAEVGHDCESEDRGEPAHAVHIEPGSRLAQIAETESWQVNSRHHQATDQVGEGLIVSARATQDGTIEALELPDSRFLLAVQWHPEDQLAHGPEQLKLFRALAGAVAQRQGSHGPSFGG